MSVPSKLDTGSYYNVMSRGFSDQLQQVYPQMALFKRGSVSVLMADQTKAPAVGTVLAPCTMVIRGAVRDHRLGSIDHKVLWCQWSSAIGRCHDC